MARRHNEDFQRAIAAHDAAVAALGLDIWVGNEPTFTDRHSQADEWLVAALGEEKHRRAAQILLQMAHDQPGSVVLRSMGRRYPGEAVPRWSFGLYGLRDGKAIWSGPCDPLLTARATHSDLGALSIALDGALGRRGFATRSFGTRHDSRIVLAQSSTLVLPQPAHEPRLLRPSIHLASGAREDPRDDLAREGLFLLIVSSLEESGAQSACVDLPAVEDVSLFIELLDGLSEAARSCGLPSLILRGFPPPVDASVSWTTVTPDPAVVEINMAPHESVLAFLQHNRRCYEIASAAGLEPYRLRFNGTVADSGGGGQITFGGPSPALSPFFVEPQLLPRLIRYAQRHPALSYLFAHDFIGPSGQSVRPDERGADALGDLKLALALLGIGSSASLDPATLWRSLAPSLADPVGNSHRAEINIEKLWNPSQPGRGQLGLVEFRAFRMQHTPERVAALAALVRAILAMLVTRDYRLELADWGAALHDRFALPFYLEADMRDVLRGLETAGVGLAPILREELEVDHWRPWTTVEFEDGTLEVRQGLDFWPLIGDASGQQGTSRLVDASTSRIEVTLRPKDAASNPEKLGAWQVRAENIHLPLRAERDPRGPVYVFGVRYRSFAPVLGLHPTLGAQQPVRLVLVNSTEPEALELALHEWRPDGAAYEGLPADLAQAASRREARCVVRRILASKLPAARVAAHGALNAYSLDLRYPSLPLPLSEKQIGLRDTPSHSGRTLDARLRIDAAHEHILHLDS